MTPTVGIDPGLDGALCLLDGEAVRVIDMPTVELKVGGKRKRELDLAQLRHILLTMRGHIWLEQATAMPGQGVTSMFRYGQTYGAIRGLIAGLQLPCTQVHPATWKRALRMPKGKDAARARASELLPSAAGSWPLKKHDGRAEACLIALYGQGEMVRESAA